MKLKAVTVRGGRNDGGVNRLQLVAETDKDRADLALLLAAIVDGKKFTAQVEAVLVEPRKRKSA